MHRQNSAGLNVAQVELGDQVDLGFFAGLRSPDGGDDLVDVVEGDLETFQDVGPLTGFAQFEFSAAADDDQAVLDVFAQDVLQTEDARLDTVD